MVPQKTLEQKIHDTVRESLVKLRFSISIKNDE